MNIKEILLKNKSKAIDISKIDEFSQDKILNKVALALNNGIKIVHFYIKNATDKQNIETAQKIRQLCSIYDSLLIINSRVDIAQVVEADGVCLSSQDVTINQAQKIIHDDKIFCSYISSFENALEALENKFDYVCLDSDIDPSIKAKISSLKDIKIIEVDKEILWQ